MQRADPAGQWCVVEQQSPGRAGVLFRQFCIPRRKHGGTSRDRRHDVPLTEQDVEEIRQLSIFRDEHRIFVNLQRNVRGAWRAGSFAGETYLPHVRISGELRAYGREDGKLMWTREIPQGVIPRIDDLQEPIFITLSRISWRGRYFLQVAAYHADTGEMLGRRSDIVSHRIIQARFDPLARRLELQSLKSKILLQLRNQPALDYDELQFAVERRLPHVARDAIVVD